MSRRTSNHDNDGPATFDDLGPHHIHDLVDNVNAVYHHPAFNDDHLNTAIDFFNIVAPYYTAHDDLRRNTP